MKLQEGMNDNTLISNGGSTMDKNEHRAKPPPVFEV